MNNNIVAEIMNIVNIFQKSRYNKQIIFINRGTGSEIWRIYG